MRYSRLILPVFLILTQISCMNGFLENAEIPSLCGFCGSVDFGNDFVPNPGNFVGIEAEDDFYCGTSEMASEHFLPGDVGVIFDSGRREFTVSLMKPDGECFRLEPGMDGPLEI